MLFGSPESRFVTTAIAIARWRRHGAIISVSIDHFEPRAYAVLQHGFHLCVLDEVVPAAAEITLADSVEIESHRACAAHHALEFDGDVFVELAEACCALGCGSLARGAADGFGR